MRKIITCLVLVACLAQPVLAAQPGRLAVVQYDSDLHFGEYDFNLARLTAYADEAVRNGANMVLLPEGALYGYASKDRLWCRPGLVACASRQCANVDEAAEPVPSGRSTQYWLKFARDKKAIIAFHIPEKADGRYYSTLVMVGPEGVLGKHRKNLLPAEDECFATEHHGTTIVRTPYGKFGLIVCADIWILPQGIASQGADAILLSTDWFEPGADETFRDRAKRAGIDIYAADVSEWDGTGKYFKNGGPRERVGLAATAKDQNGISYHELKY
jgi:predicted amidohydrolase